MKTLNNHTILYDATCPMCRLYTGAFVNGHLLDRDGRAPYQQLQEGSFPGLDKARAVNEIALVNRLTGEVTYGVESLFRILGNRWRWMRPLFRWPLFAWLTRKAYSLVSYNRRVIMPAAEGEPAMAPAFHRGWRAAWIGLAWLVTAFLLQHYTVRMNGLLPDGATWREYAVCGGQILWQGVLVGIMAPRKLWDYLGAMMTVSLAGGIALALFGTVLDGFGLQSPWVAAALFASVAGLMLAEHLRRCRVLCLPWTVSAGWVLYRLLLLYIIMKG